MTKFPGCILHTPESAFTFKKGIPSAEEASIVVSSEEEEDNDTL